MLQKYCLSAQVKMKKPKILKTCAIGSHLIVFNTLNKCKLCNFLLHVINHIIINKVCTPVKKCVHNEQTTENFYIKFKRGGRRNASKVSKSIFILRDTKFCLEIYLDARLCNRISYQIVIRYNERLLTDDCMNSNTQLCAHH